MRVSVLFIISVSLLFMLSQPSLSAASTDENAADGQAQAVTSTAVGHVTVYLLEWQPDLSGVGSGLFTFSSFDLGGFFDELASEIAGLFGG